MMPTPDFYFIDRRGQRLPSDKEGVQHIRQYRGYWCVRVEGEWNGKVAIKGNRPLPLDRVSRNEWEPPYEEWTKSEGRLKGAVGEITVYLCDVDQKPIIGTERILRIEPANVSWGELDAMLKDIGMLAIQYASCAEADVKTNISGGVGQEGVGAALEGGGALLLASRLIDLYQTFKNNWPAIQQRPLKSISSRLGVVRLDKAQTAPMLLIKQKMEPHRKSAAGLAIEESTDCSENEFLAYVLDRYLIRESKGIIYSLQMACEKVERSILSKVSDVEDAVGNSPVAVNKAREKQNEFRPLYKSHKEDIEQAMNKLRAATEWASVLRRSNFFKGITFPAHLPPRSLRLTHSSHYGPVYAKFIACQVHTGSDLERGLVLLETVQKQRIRAAWNIYELWCVVKFYTVLVTTLHLKPPEGEGSLFERATFEDGDFCLPTNKPFNLERDFGNRKVEVSLWYEKEYLEHKTYGRPIAKPDIVIEVKVNGGLPQTFCFDAKYRDYAKQKSEKFLEDVLATAHEKYQERLGLKSGFILHTDRTVDYWGEVPTKQYVKEKFDEELDETLPIANQWAGHRYGAVRLRPNKDRERFTLNCQFQKLLQLIFQYHENSPLRDVCMNCGYLLNLSENTTLDIEKASANTAYQHFLDDEKQEVIEGKNRKQALYCSCPRCFNFWIVQRCRGVNHPIIKTKKELCLHRQKPNDEHNENKQEPSNKDTWLYICPVCSDNPKFQQRQVIS